MQHVHGLIQPGRYRAVLIGRTKSPSASSGGRNPSGQSHIDLLFELIGSSVPRRRLKHRVWAESSKARAKRLKQGQEVVVVVRTVTLDSGKVVNRVIDFHAANEPSVIEAMTNDDGDTVVTKPPLVAAADQVLPVELWQRLMTAGPPSEAKPGPASILAAALPVGADAELLPAPRHWGDLPDGRIPPGTHGFDDQGRPRNWPLRFTKAHWAALLPGLPPGRYTLRCRSIDEKGIAQPMPRPLRKGGHAAIEAVEFRVSE